MFTPISLATDALKNTRTLKHTLERILQVPSALQAWDISHVVSSMFLPILSTRLVAFFAVDTVESVCMAGAMLSNGFVAHVDRQSNISISS